MTLAFKKESNRRDRLCIDFREINKIVVPESQPFPRIEDVIVKAGICHFFSTFDINSAFWSIPIKKEDREKTAFITQNGHWQCQKIISSTDTLTLTKKDAKRYYCFYNIIIFDKLY